jgi:hypothetical protein
MHQYRAGKPEKMVEILEEAYAKMDVYGAKPSTRVKDANILVLTTLAAHHTQTAAKRMGKERARLIERATVIYNKADHMDRGVHALHKANLVGRGYLLLVEGHLDKAARSFDYVLSKTANDVPALLGRACVNFNQKKYAEVGGRRHRPRTCLLSFSSLRRYRGFLRVPRCEGTVAFLGFLVAKVPWLSSRNAAPRLRGQKQLVRQAA